MSLTYFSETKWIRIEVPRPLAGPVFFSLCLLPLVSRIVTRDYDTAEVADALVVIKRVVVIFIELIEVLNGHFPGQVELFKECNEFFPANKTVVIGI